MRMRELRWKFRKFKQRIVWFLFGVVVGLLLAYVGLPVLENTGLLPAGVTETLSGLA